MVEMKLCKQTQALVISLKTHLNIDESTEMEWQRETKSKRYITQANRKQSTLKF